MKHAMCDQEGLLAQCKRRCFQQATQCASPRYNRAIAGVIERSHWHPRLRQGFRGPLNGTRGITHPGPHQYYPRRPPAPEQYSRNLPADKELYEARNIVDYPVD